MRHLALDTSSLACTVAVQDGDVLVTRHAEQAREHTRLLLPMIREVLDEASLALADLDAIVLGNGPGSFIGMRIAASVAQGLAYGANLPIIPVSSLAAVAAAVLDASDADGVAVAQDAHMKEVYLGLYARNKDGLPQAITAERLQSQEPIEELAESTIEFTAAGEGWQRYPELFDCNVRRLTGQPQVLYPEARYLLAIAEQANAVTPFEIEPAYLRQKVAEKPRSGVG